VLLHTSSTTTRESLATYFVHTLQKYKIIGFNTLQKIGHKGGNYTYNIKEINLWDDPEQDDSARY
jgi:hypothetical protein